MATNDRFIVHNANPGIAPRAVRLEYRNGTMLGDTPTTRGRVPVQKARSGGQALKQESVPHLGYGDVSVVRTRGC